MNTVWPAGSVNSKKYFVAPHKLHKIWWSNQKAYLALTSATTHLTISPVNRNVFCSRHKSRFVSLKLSFKVSEKQKSNAKQNKGSSYNVPSAIKGSLVSYYLLSKQGFCYRLSHSREMFNHSRSVAFYDCEILRGNAAIRQVFLSKWLNCVFTGL